MLSLSFIPGCPYYCLIVFCFSDVVALLEYQPKLLTALSTIPTDKCKVFKLLLVYNKINDLKQTNKKRNLIFEIDLGECQSSDIAAVGAILMFLAIKRIGRIFEPNNSPMPSG